MVQAAPGPIVLSVYSGHEKRVGDASTLTPYCILGTLREEEKRIDIRKEVDMGNEAIIVGDEGLVHGVFHPYPNPDPGSNPDPNPDSNQNPKVREQSN